MLYYKKDGTTIKKKNSTSLLFISVVTNDRRIRQCFSPRVGEFRGKIV